MDKVKCEVVTAYPEEKCEIIRFVSEAVGDLAAVETVVRQEDPSLFGKFEVGKNYRVDFDEMNVVGRGGEPSRQWTAEAEDKK